MIILGLNAWHADSAACILRDGELIAAAEEERFRRVKHWAGFPELAVRYCLAEAGIGLDGVDRIAINRDPRTNLWRKLVFTLRRRPAPRYILDRLGHARRWASIGEEFVARFPGAPLRAPIRRVEHHRAHLASAFLVSPFAEAVAVSVDGSGDFATAAWGVGQGTGLSVDGRIAFPHSLGIFYETLTQYLGFPHYGDEYKVMGLAPYGEPRFAATLRRLVRLRVDGSFRLDLGYFVHHRVRREFQWQDCAPGSGDLVTPALEALLGPRRRADEPLEQRHKDLARSIQAVYEEAFFHLLNRLYARYRIDTLVLAGGCANNSVANGKIAAMTPFRRCFIQPAAGDAGGAIGAAFDAWQAGGGARRFVMDHAGWGPGFTDAEIAAVLKLSTQAGTEAVPADASGPAHLTLPSLRNGSLPLPPHGRRGGVAPVFSLSTPGGQSPPLCVTQESALLCAAGGEGRGEAAGSDGSQWVPAQDPAARGAIVLRRIDDPGALCREVAAAIAAGKVVGWFQGRMEWGARALGSRSILGDPRRADMKEILNRKIKRRESFRPFAPSILREAVPDWFETDGDVPFMMQVLPIRAERRAEIPAVTHVDGSGRLQTVDPATNPLYHRLIAAFRDLTGVPMVLNTSFNENEPIVCRPEEALDCFLRTRMDVLAMGRFLLTRNEDGGASAAAGKVAAAVG